APNVHFPPHTFPLSSPPSGLWLSVHFTLPAFPFLQVFKNTLHTHTHTLTLHTLTHTHLHYTHTHIIQLCPYSVCPYFPSPYLLSLLYSIFPRSTNDPLHPLFLFLSLTHTHKRTQN